MQPMFQNTKKLIVTCLVSVLLVTSMLLSFPAPASALGNFVDIDSLVDIDSVTFNCETSCGSTAAFTAGVISGSAVTLLATGSGGSVAAAGITGITVVGQAATTAATTVAAPILAPVAATAAVGYGAYRLWENHHHD
ncbi:hypothetical protein [Lyngbya aestuarii]|uniref:hypothetical protein n=1 Tax=Lyngbya aestuarii TaxID=118322 RepID=UPI00403DE4EF